MSITLKAQLGLIASDCVEIKGLQKLDGKYYIEKITHSIGSRLQNDPGDAAGWRNGSPP